MSEALLRLYEASNERDPLVPVPPLTWCIFHLCDTVGVSTGLKTHASVLSSGATFAKMNWHAYRIRVVYEY